jgi:hypothetical protein
MVTSFTYNSIEAVLMREAHRMPWGATVVVISAMLNDDMLATLTRLRGLGHRLIVLTLVQPDLRHHLTGVTIHRIADVAEFEGESPLPPEEE